MAHNESRAPERERRKGVSDSDRPPGARVPPAGEAIEQARAAGADLLLTPELALSGYPPEDLLLRPDFYRACAREVGRIAGEKYARLKRF